MADQDGLVQVGFELVLKESVAQDNTGQVDLSLQPNPEVTLGVAAVVHEHPLHQISPMQDKAIPVGSAPDRGGSAPPFDLSQLVEILTNMQNQQRNDMQSMESQMDANAQAMKKDLQDLQTQMKGDMQNMGISLQAQMKAGQEEMKAELGKAERRNADHESENGE